MKISKNWGNNKVEIDQAIAKFGNKRGGISLRLTELKILFYYVLQAKIRYLNQLLNTNP